MIRQKTLIAAACVLVLTVITAAQGTGGREQLTKGQTLWNQRLARSAIASLEAATKNRATAAEAYEALGRIYTFKGWQQEGAFPGWHDEPAYREKARAALRAAVSANPNRQSAREALKTAEGFAAADKVDPAPPRPEIAALEAKIQTASEPQAIVAAVDARMKAQADPLPLFAGAQMLIDRNEPDRAIALAERGLAASDRFIDENLSAYQLEGKVQGTRARNGAIAADLIGWAQGEKKNYAAAAAKLQEAERLSQGLDFQTLYHIAELARLQNDLPRARDYYLNALSLAGGPAPMPQRIMPALTALRGGAGADGYSRRCRRGHAVYEVGGDGAVAPPRGSQERRAQEPRQSSAAVACA